MQNFHTHVWDQRLHFSEQTIRESERSRGYALDLTVEFDPFMADMAPFDRVVVFGLKARRCGYWVPDEYVAAFVARAPAKLIGFASCDPSQPACMEELVHAIEGLHLSGVKIGPTYAGIDPRDPKCDAIYRYCERRGLPIIFHTGTTFNSQALLEYGRPWIWDELGMKHPDLRMVLAHVGHPFCEECLAVIRKHQYMYADISALYYRPWQFYNMLVAAQEYGVTGKLLFGTDYPFAAAQASVDGLLNVNVIIGRSGLPQIRRETIDGILRRDACAVLGIGGKHP